MYYLAKDGKGDGEDAGVHFTRGGQEPDIPAFLSRLWKAPWCFKVILSPDPHISPTLPLQEVAQSWMRQVEADLGVKLDWIGAMHHDTNTPHAQFLWSGRTLAGVVLCAELQPGEPEKGYTWKTVAYVPAQTWLATGVISGCLSWAMALGLTYLKGIYVNTLPRGLIARGSET